MKIGPKLFNKKKPTLNGKFVFSKEVRGTHVNGTSVSSQYKKSMTHLYTVSDFPL